MDAGPGIVVRGCKTLMLDMQQGRERCKRNFWPLQNRNNHRSSSTALGAKRTIGRRVLLLAMGSQLGAFGMLTAQSG